MLPTGITPQPQIDRFGLLCARPSLCSLDPQWTATARSIEQELGRRVKEKTANTLPSLAMEHERRFRRLCADPGICAGVTPEWAEVLRATLTEYDRLGDVLGQDRYLPEQGK